MGKFFRGLLVGIGIGLLFAPIPGQRMRQVFAERIQKLRGYLPENVQAIDLPAQISDSTTQISNTLKRSIAPTAAQNKATTIQQTDEPQQTGSKRAQTLVSSSVATAPMPSSSNVSSTRGSVSLDSSLSTIPGIEPDIQKALEAQGINTRQQLLEQASTKQERVELAHKAGLGVHQLKTLIDRADLMRLQGIDGDVVTLLEEAGVTGCKDLSHRNPEHLHATLTELYQGNHIASPSPELEQIMQWIGEAKGVPV